MKIRVESIVNADMESTWKAWNSPNDINQWNAASDDWRTANSVVDLSVGGKFCYRMEAKDGSMGFDFAGTYTRVVEHKLIEYALEDGRTVSVEFEEVEGGVKVTETFDVEDEHSAEQQRQGWQSILDRFKKYVEAKE